MMKEFPKLSILLGFKPKISSLEALNFKIAYFWLRVWCMILKNRRILHQKLSRFHQIPLTDVRVLPAKERRNEKCTKKTLPGTNDVDISRHQVYRGRDMKNEVREAMESNNGETIIKSVN